MEPKDFTERTLSSETLFSGRLLTVKRDEVELPDGSHSTREYICHPGAVVILPRFENSDLLLVRQYRYALRQEFLEFPAGKIDPGEAPEVTARRELLEETGYSAREWQHLGDCHPCIGYADEVIHIYLAEGLSGGIAQPDEDEFLQPLRISRLAADALVGQGGITDAKTLSGLYWLNRLAR
ncbi:MAG: NUDIX hydrolase [Gammaproteobacteria bacterium]|nr:NUDIX hydrolase [Gammaproteobacteria bacterium]